ncbi:MAG: ribbon-helix-helix protein, CopG family [Bryobacteraceae bacterium]|nr:ribbon-helix-helix protein, CopG family [Bryobacteraceae bacterium]
MSHRLQVLIPPELDAKLEKAAARSSMSKGAWVRTALEAALDRSGQLAGEDSVARLAALDAPTSDIDQMLSEIEAGRV